MASFTEEAVPVMAVRYYFFVVDYRYTPSNPLQQVTWLPILLSLSYTG